MDEQIAKLERLCELDPANIAYHQQLARVSKRSGETRYSKLVRDFIDELEGPRWTIPTATQWITEKLGQSAKDMVPVFALLLDHKSDSIRRRAAWVLPEICSEAMVPELAQLLGDGDQEMRKTAATILERLGPMAQWSIPQLVSAMKDNSHDVRRIALRTLVAFKNVNDPAIVSGLRSRDPVVRAFSAEFIGRNKVQIGLTPLMRALDDAQSRVRRSAALALGTFGEDASGAVPIIIELLEDEQLPWTAIEALGQIANPQALEFLENCFQNAWHFDRSSVIRAICHTESKGPDLVDPLLQRIFREGPYAWVENQGNAYYDYNDNGDEISDSDSWTFTENEDLSRVANFLSFHRDAASAFLWAQFDSNISYELRLAVHLLLELKTTAVEIELRLSARENPSLSISETLIDISRRLNR
ncbi:MAG: HEAT repeat domain-containing protein [Planctomycetota bacterium]|nr:HEAT repeat domain-containing protein [Planctomycetota bacterium]